MKINKSDLINAVAQRDGNRKYIVKGMIDDIFDEIRLAVIRGDTVSIIGFGTFEAREYKSHAAVHPVTGEPIIVPEFHNITFNPSQEFTKNVRESLDKKAG